MARIRPITREEAAPEVQAIFDANLEMHGEVLNTTGVYAHRPTIHLGSKALADGIIASGLISKRLRHLINVRIAGTIGCPF